MYMANMAWNSSMNTSGVMKMLTDTDETANTSIPASSIPTPIPRKWSPTPTSSCPTPPTWNATTASRSSTARSAKPRPPPTPSAGPWSNPTATCAASNPCSATSAHACGLPGFTNDDGSQKYADYADYIQNHERKPGIGPLAGFRGDGTEGGRGAPNPNQIEEYKKERQLLDFSHIPEDAEFYKPWNMAYQDWAVNLGLFDAPSPYLFTLWCEPLRRFQLAAEGKHRLSPPEHLKARYATTMDPLPTWYPTSAPDETFTVNALTQRPMAMYHSWGSQNAWLRQIHGRNPLYVPTKIWEANDFKKATGPKSPPPRRNHRARRPYGGSTTTPSGPGTPSANGKGPGPSTKTRPRRPRASCSTTSSTSCCRPKGDGLRWANSDPITGQAAWFDLKVKIEKANAPAESQPHTRPRKAPSAKAPRHVKQKLGA